MRRSSQPVRGPRVLEASRRRRRAPISRRRSPVRRAGCRLRRGRRPSPRRRPVTGPVCEGMEWGKRHRADCGSRGHWPGCDPAQAASAEGGAALPTDSSSPLSRPWPRSVPGPDGDARWCAVATEDFSS